METEYLKENVSCLAACLKEVAEKRPNDPIEYIANWLKKHKENELFKAKKAEEADLYEKFKAEEALEQERKAKRLEEARKLAEEEVERIKQEQIKKAREAESASKLSMVEEKDENVTPREAGEDEKVDGTKDEEDDRRAEEEGTEQPGEKSPQERNSPEDTAGAPAEEV